MTNKFQIQKLKSETESPRKKSNQIDPIVCVKLLADCIQLEFRSMVAKTAENYSGASTNHFPPFLKGVKGDFLKLGIWILFDICYL